MRTCPSEDSLDRYVMNTLTEEQAAEIEEHYFNCPVCFRKISERNELVEVVRARGAEIFEGTGPDRIDARTSIGEKVSAFLAPRRRLAVAASAAVLVLAAALLFLPKSGGRAPEFTSTGDAAVRGESLTPLSPLGTMRAAPSAFEWEAVRGAASYRISLSGPGTEWSAETKEAEAVLPDAVRRTMPPGSYQWRVKAYTAQGALLAASGKAEFTISAKRLFPLP